MPLLASGRGSGLFLAALCLTILPDVAAAQGGTAAPRPATGCETCHAQLADPPMTTAARAFQDDVHRARGFTCVDCHGGDPAATDKAAAKSPATKYRALSGGAEVVAACARCHSDAAFMRQYSPTQRIDQAAEYATSVHGQRLAEGDTKVATCTSCHQAHGIRLVSDARSPVYPLNVGATCARCHADESRMAGYTKADTSPLGTNQHADYQQSVHFTALTKGNDLSAPTCNDCHGNHGAAPPGVGSVANVCGTCHAVFATRFEQSVHKDVFDRGCIECHDNHAVKPPSDDMLAVGQNTLCGTCHDGDKGAETAVHIRSGIESLKTGLARAEGLIQGVQNAGMEVTDQELALNEARNHLTLARTELHAANVALVDPVIAEGLKIVAKVETEGQGHVDELRFRRRGLAASLGAILLFAVALALKIRQQDRRLGVRAKPPSTT
jgi:predicted CXXCH cytochrome family protein